MRSAALASDDTAARDSSEEPPVRGPSRLRLLCSGAAEPSWVSLTLQLDAQGCLEPYFRWVPDPVELLTLLRDESFDCLVLDGGLGTGGRVFDRLAPLRAVRASGCDDPILLVVPAANDELWNAAHTLKLELLVTASGWQSLALAPSILRAIERVHLQRENYRLELANRRRMLRDRDEAEYLLNQQRQILQQLEAVHRDEAIGDEENSESEPPDENGAAGPAEAVGDRSAEPLGWSAQGADGSSGGIPEPTAVLPPALEAYYQELLRTYVIMGSGTLGAEIARLVELLAAAGLSPRQALELHLLRVEQLVSGLGNRSTRHVMARADLLALELMIHLGENYQRRAAA